MEQRTIMIQLLEEHQEKWSDSKTGVESYQSVLINRVGRNPAKQLHLMTALTGVMNEAWEELQHSFIPPKIYHFLRAHFEMCAIVLSQVKNNSSAAEQSDLTHQIHQSMLHCLSLLKKTQPNGSQQLSPEMLPDSFPIDQLLRECNRLKLSISPVAMRLIHKLQMRKLSDVTHTAHAVYELGQAACESRIPEEPVDLTWLIQKPERLGSHEAGFCLNALANLASTRQLAHPISSEKVNQLMGQMVGNKKLDLRGIACGIQGLRQLLEDGTIRNPSELNVGHLNTLLAKLAKQPELISFDLIHSILLSMTWLNLTSCDPKQLDLSTLTPVLALCLKKEEKIPEHQSVSILMSIGQMLQAAEYPEQERKKLAAWSNQTIRSLTPKVQDMQLSDVAHTLYACILLDHQMDQDASNIWSKRCETLLKSASKTDPCTIRSAQQYAEYLYHSGCKSADLPQWLSQILLNNRPILNPDSPQAKLAVELERKTQGLPKSHPLSGYSCEQEVRVAAWWCDLGLRKKDDPNAPIFIIERDGSQHKFREHLRPNDARRDKRIESLKSQTQAGQHLYRVIRIPSHLSINESLERIWLQLEQNIHQPKVVEKPKPSARTQSPKSAPQPPAPADIKISLIPDDLLSQLERESAKPISLKEHEELATIDTLNQAIQKGNLSAVESCLKKQVLSHATKDEKAKLLFLALDSDKPSLDIMRRVLGEIKSEIITHKISHDGKEPQSALLWAVKQNRLSAISCFIERSHGRTKQKRKKDSKATPSVFSDPQWPEALQIARRDNRIDIANRLEKEGIREIPKPDIKQPAEKKRKTQSIHLNECDWFGSGSRSNPMSIEEATEKINVILRAEALGIQINDKRYAEAYFELGCAYISISSPEAMKKAVDMFKKASEFGLLDAYFRLGICYNDGYGVAKNSEEAKRCFKKASEVKNAPAANLALGLYYVADGNEVGIKKGAEILETVSKENPAYIRYVKTGSLLREKLAYIYFAQERPQEGEICLEISASKGNSNSQILLGIIRISKQPTEAKALFQKASKAKQFPNNLVGSILEEDLLGQENPNISKIMRLLKSLQDCGALQAEICQLWVAHISHQMHWRYQSAGNTKRAFDVLMAASEAGFDHPKIEVRIGLSYLLGQGVPINKQKAQYHLEKAAKAGNEEASIILAKIYEDQDPDKIKSVLAKRLDRKSSHSSPYSRTVDEMLLALETKQKGSTQEGERRFEETLQKVHKMIGFDAEKIKQLTQQFKEASVTGSAAPALPTIRFASDSPIYASSSSDSRKEKSSANQEENLTPTSR